jgi:hypothetical protein
VVIEEALAGGAVQKTTADASPGEACTAVGMPGAPAMTGADMADVAPVPKAFTAATLKV